jgi:hypothetical protein
LDFSLFESSLLFGGGALHGSPFGLCPVASFEVALTSAFGQLSRPLLGELRQFPHLLFAGSNLIGSLLACGSVAVARFGRSTPSLLDRFVPCSLGLFASFLRLAAGVFHCFPLVR